jgi:hypothetical protein
VPENQELNRTADILFQVQMKDGKKRRLLLLIEIQNRKEDDLTKRIFWYVYWIFDWEGNFPITLLLLTDCAPYSPPHRLPGRDCGRPVPNLGLFYSEAVILKGGFRSSGGKCSRRREEKSFLLCKHRTSGSDKDPVA